jgi:hypothetical protein
MPALPPVAAPVPRSGFHGQGNEGVALRNKAWASRAPPSATPRAIRSARQRGHARHRTELDGVPEGQLVSPHQGAEPRDEEVKQAR